jgi:hypothetical protein
LENSLATVDLEAASDTVSFNTVTWLFPMEWYTFLNDVRSPQFKTSDGEIRNYAKFSSMGNGATFSVETLIFAAAAFAVGSKRFSVYGDDIIIESELYEPLFKLLRFFGFHINQEKTFTDGPFRESCGANWLNGVDITPFYLRDVPNRKCELSHMVNGLASIGLPEGRLWKRAKDIILSWNLRSVPFNGVSTSGVWIDVTTAYRKKLFRTRSHIQSYRVYLDKTATLRKTCSRTLFLWHLEVFRYRTESLSRRPGWQEHFFRGSHSKTWLQRRINSDLRGIATSRVPAYSRKYVSKWVGWFPPAMAAPVHIYMWTEYVLRD